MVEFRTDFSDALVGIAWEIVSAPLIDASNGKEFVSIRTRSHGGGWSYRSAYVTDLIDH